MRIDIYGPSRCSYLIAKLAAKAIDKVIVQYFGQPKEVRTYGNNTFGNVIKSHFQNRAVWSHIDKEKPDAQVWWYSQELKNRFLPLDEEIQTISMVKDQIVDTRNIPASKFCEVYGWQAGDVVECTEEAVVLKIETVSHFSSIVYGRRCNQFEQDFGDVQEIFPDYRYRKVEL